MKTDNTELFERMPVSKAVITLVIPTVITVIYNIADIFFIGQMNNPNQVAAATLIMPPFVMLTGIANLFGIGGSSLISRSLGADVFVIAPQRRARCSVHVCDERDCWCRWYPMGYSNCGCPCNACRFDFVCPILETSQCRNGL